MVGMASDALLVLVTTLQVYTSLIKTTYKRSLMFASQQQPKFARDFASGSTNRNARNISKEVAVPVDKRFFH